MDAGWEQALRLKMEQRSLNFCALERRRPQAGDMLEDAEELGRKKAARDPMSHRIIEKRRRDRMNNCLADLSRLIPAVYLKKVAAARALTGYHRPTWSAPSRIGRPLRCLSRLCVVSLSEVRQLCALCRSTGAAQESGLSCSR
ncbi:uncharacterized protein LOC119434553 isoform X3 [Dermacentor silvarum]|uniref:uncharacterized protein LOC119434553 isoform X3 n=1 Tax=Dermacentor silvarum TaxID=543639 RepID=UPI001899BB82|nr:uncharacterized protein LOC119434553 isoform X3 [Dermacentor silvarum]